jgi:hypothetical protein
MHRRGNCRKSVRTGCSVLRVEEVNGEIAVDEAKYEQISSGYGE